MTFRRLVAWHGRYCAIVAQLCLATSCVGRVASESIVQPAICREAPGLANLLRPGGVLLLGEIHGTDQTPAFVANAACLALEGGNSVVVALEIPEEEADRIDAFIISNGDNAERERLMQGAFWNAEFQDGRRSNAMLGLLDSIRQFKRRGRAVRVAFIDRSEQPANPGDRDRWMADALARAADENPSATVIALIGDVHTRISRGTPWDEAYEPAGYALRTMRPNLPIVALDIAHLGGTAWFCTEPSPSSCGVRRVGASGQAVERVLLHPTMVDGHSGVYGVGVLTASPPAKQR